MARPITQSILNQLSNPHGQQLAQLGQTANRLGQQNRQSKLNQLNSQSIKLQQEKVKADLFKANAPVIHSGLTQLKDVPLEQRFEAAQELFKGVPGISELIDDPEDFTDEKISRNLNFTGQLMANSNKRNNPATKAFAPVLVENDEGEKKLVIPTFNPNTNKAELSAVDMKNGFRLAKETGQEKREADVQAKIKTKRGEATAKSQAERREDQINQGLDAADGFANVERALTLMNNVETGGIDNASLKAKQFFGIEGADEAELSNRMGKAVLSQLRATFGAAFTAAEGKQLQVIEAGFGKSTEGNRRLLEQTKRIILRSARRGIRAAKATGDLDTVADIEEALAFTLDDKPEQPKQALPQINEQGWQLMTDGQGNQAYVGPNNEVQEVK